MEWKFKELQPSDTKLDPKHLELFRNKTLNDIVSALIREDVQNRLDAVNNNKLPVRIRYHLSGRGFSVNGVEKKKLLNGLTPHLLSPLTVKQIGRTFDPDMGMPYLVIECFNTTGLKGDYKQFKDPIEEEKKNRNDYYWFIRNVGRTGKKEGDRGRWGLGKIVYPASSAIRSFFCYSVRTDGSHLLAGRSVLAIHTVEGKEHTSEGYYGVFNNSDTYFAMPETNDAEIEFFLKCFSVNRRNKEPGTTLVIPYPDISISKNNIVLWLLQSYFLEIMRGKLIVEVSEGASDHAVVLTDKTIDSVVRTWAGLPEQEKKMTQRRLEFCRKAENLKLVGEDAPYFDLEEPSSFTNPDFLKMLSPNQVEKATKLYSNNEVVGFELKLTLENQKEGAKKVGSFLIFLQKDDDLDEPDETFIRDGLAIIKEKYIREPGVRALILAEHSPVNEFLGDAENPAHTEWDHNTEHFLGKYKNGKAILGYIQKAALKLTQLLGAMKNETLENLLGDIFFIPDNEHTSSRGKIERRGKKTPPKPIISAKAAPRYCETYKIDKTGFRVVPAKAATKVPKSIEIIVAYDVEGAGNPFISYHPADFDFKRGKIKVKIKGGEIQSMGFNELVVKITDKEYAIEVTGFDSNRDLATDVTPIIEKKNEGE